MNKILGLATFIIRLNQKNRLNLIRSTFLRIKSTQFTNQPLALKCNPQTTFNSRIFSNIALLSFGGITLLNISNEEHNTRLSRAIRYGNKTEIIQQLKSGLDPNSRHPLGMFSTLAIFGHNYFKQNINKFA